MSLSTRKPALSTAHLAGMRTALARALSIDDQRLRTVTPHRLFLSTIAALAARNVETITDLLREFNHHNDVTVAYKAFGEAILFSSRPASSASADARTIQVGRRG